jgi:hypothetical protein
MPFDLRQLITPLQIGLPAALVVTAVYWLIVSRMAWKLRLNDPRFRVAPDLAHFWSWSLRRLLADSHYAWVFLAVAGPCVLAVRLVQMFLLPAA